MPTVTVIHKGLVDFTWQYQFLRNAGFGGIFLLFFCSFVLYL